MALITNASYVFMAGFFLYLIHHITAGKGNSAGLIRMYILLNVFVFAAVIGIREGVKNIEVSSQSLGRVTSVNVEVGGFLSPTVSTIETPSGFYSVRGSISAKRGGLATQVSHPLGVTEICIDDSCYAEG